jgi:hypothetical protein
MSAWYTYIFQAQTDAEFNLPYNPTKILKVNYVKLSHLLGWLSYLPRIAHYLYWRYWQLGSERFKQIVRCVFFFAQC